MPFRVVFYSLRRRGYLSDVLTRCINARTVHFCRRVWGGEDGQGAVLFEGDTVWTTHAKAVEIELKHADVILVDRGKVAKQHQSWLADKPVITVAQNSGTLDDTYVRSGLPGITVDWHRNGCGGPYDWKIVPTPIPLWEEQFQGNGKRPDLCVCCLHPNELREILEPDTAISATPGHMLPASRILPSLRSISPELEVFGGDALDTEHLLEILNTSHVFVDDCSTGVYSCESLRALATGNVVINGVGLRPDIREAFCFCAGGTRTNPFVFAQRHTLNEILKLQLKKGIGELLSEGAASRQWMQNNWDFEKQWAKFWMPVVESAVEVQRSRRSRRRSFLRTPALPPSMPTASVVVVTRNEGSYLRRTLHSLARTIDSQAEIIVVDDGSTDGSIDHLAEVYPRVRLLQAPRRLGISAARNLGAKHARGQIVVFSDAHIEVPRNWLDDVLQVLSLPNVAAVGPGINNLKRRTGSGKCGGTWRWSEEKSLAWKWLARLSSEPYPVPFLCGCFVAVKRSVLDAVGGFDSGMLLYGLEDAELCLRLWTMGYESWVCPGTTVAHRFGSADPSSPAPYKFRQNLYLHNELRLAMVHFNEPRLASFLQSRTQCYGFSTIFARLRRSDAGKRRAEVCGSRKYDDDWFFAKFSLN